MKKFAKIVFSVLAGLIILYLVINLWDAAVFRPVPFLHPLFLYFIQFLFMLE
ncbi:MAG: hypothetical protein GY950_19565 [bacterium]|nr:hypothetical protein [bacterium]